MADFKEIFGDQKLGLEEFNEAIKAKGLKLVNLADGKYVDKDKFDKSEIERKKFEADLKEKDELLKKYDGADIEALKASNAEMSARHQKELADAMSKHDSDVAELKKTHALADALRSHNVQDIKAMDPFIDKSIIKIEDDKIVGLDEQIKSLKETKGFLFKEEKTGGIKVGTGGDHKTPPVGGDDSALRAAAGLKTN